MMSIAKVLLFLALVGLCFGNDRDLYHDFLVKYNKHYRIGGREYNYRFEIFKSNLQLIEKENAKNSGVKLGITKFADLTNEEFRALHKGKFVNSPLPRVEFDDVAFPATFNWADHGVVGPVEDGGDCDSSYVFTVVQSVSSVYTISKNSSYVALSTEQVASCSDSGCNGGDDDEVLQYIEGHGLEFNFKNGSCPKGRVKDGVCIKGSSCVTQGNEASLAAALVAQGPLFVAIDASQESFQLYSGGVYESTSCSSTRLDLSLLLVGYNQEAWICQNHWGEDWGIDGYIWIARNKNNMCGIATDACYPTGVAAC